MCEEAACLVCLVCPVCFLCHGMSSVFPLSVWAVCLVTLLLVSLLVLVFVGMALGGAYNYRRIRDWLTYKAVPTAPQDAKPQTTTAPATTLGIQTIHSSFLDSFCRTGGGVSLY